jgi:hypothetical protein
MAPAEIENFTGSDRARLPLIGFSPADLRVARSLDVQLEEAAILKERLAALEHRP